MINLLHYSNNPKLSITRDNFFSKMGWNENMYFKPSGLWVTPEDSEDDYTWPMFCNDGSGLKPGKHRYNVTIDESKLLSLNTVPELEAFTKKYAIEDWTFENWVDWNKVSKDYNGVLIIPYQWEFRMVSWYYPWDCSSGCIWDYDPIIDIVKDSKYGT